MLEQQSLASVQLVPSERHVEQTPLLHVRPTQQSPWPLQDWLTAAHVVQI
jgi:hypothetical protein